MSKGIGAIQKKVLLLLMAGISLGFTRTPRQYSKILRATVKAWKEIDQKELRKSIRRLYENKLVDYKEHKDGTTTIVLTRDGKEQARVLEYKTGEMKIPVPKTWDRKWRLVIFDIPDELKRTREDFRHRLRQLGFYHLQRSVLVYPFECDDEIDFLIEFFSIRRFVRKLVVEKIDNDLHLRTIFSSLIAEK